MPWAQSICCLKQQGHVSGHLHYVVDVLPQLEFLEEGGCTDALQMFVERINNSTFGLFTNESPYNANP